MCVYLLAILATFIGIKMIRTLPQNDDQVFLCCNHHHRDHHLRSNGIVSNQSNFLALEAVKNTQNKID